MYELYNSTGTGAGLWVHLGAAGLYKLTADVPSGDAATMTYEEREGESGVAHPIHADGVAIAHSDGSPSHVFFATAGTFVRATRTGGAANVRAAAVPVF